jgi:hypothetical protein
MPAWMSEIAFALRADTDCALLAIAHHLLKDRKKLLDL